MPRYPAINRDSEGGKALLTTYEVIIIGSGAGGGTMAYHLAPCGKKILLLERGGCPSVSTASGEREHTAP